MSEATIVERDARVFFRQEGSTPGIAALRAIGGAWLEDEHGRRSLDLHGNSAHHIGHAHPRLIAALRQQLDVLPFSPRRYTNEPATRLAERLAARFRGGHAKVLLTPGGSDAVEVALRLARVATGRPAIIALEGSYHGHGMGSLSLSSRSLDGRLGRPLPDIHHVTPYWDQGGGAQMLMEIERTLRQTAGGVACVIAEPIRSNCIVPPAGLWQDVARLCADHGAKLIFDEIPCGLGKTGRFFAHEHFGVTPDIVVLGKALGGGVVPVAAVVADADLDVAPELAIGHYTHEKNPLLARAALTTLDIIEDEGLVLRAASLGETVRACFAAAAAHRPRAGYRGVRGLGLLLAVEFDDGDGASDRPPLAERLVAAALEHGVSTTAKDRRSVGFSPPLTITTREIETAVEGLMRAAEALEAPKSPQ